MHRELVAKFILGVDGVPLEILVPHHCSSTECGHEQLALDEPSLISIAEHHLDLLVLIEGFVVGLHSLKFL